MMQLLGIHAGETAAVVGRGPSLLGFTAEDFGPGPIIALNHAILRLRQLALLNPIYTMQKDGCIDHGIDPAFRPLRGLHVCNSTRMVSPQPPETVLLSAHESPDCFLDYPLRYVFDVEADFGLPWHTPSTPIAVRLAALMGCSAVVLMAHDSHLGDYRRVEGDQLVPDSSAYADAAEKAMAAASATGLDLQWLP